jgi:hypothetical protein
MSKVAIEGNIAGSGTLTISAPNTNSNFTLSLPTNTGTIITQNSTPAFASTIGVGGATAAASGAGITFPATQSASSDANTLDDYEEGTWTPVINGTTMTTGSGWYTKIGRQVFLGYNNLVGVTAISNNANATVTGFPFAISSYTQGGTVAISFNDESDSYKDCLLVGRTTNLLIEFTNRSGVATTTSDPFNLVVCYQII